MAFGWAKTLLKKKEEPVRVQLCEHDLEDMPMIPLLPMNTRKRLEVTWIKLQDVGVLRAANRMYLRMQETLLEEQLQQLDEDFRYVETNPGHVSLSSTKPFKDKCYYMLKSVERMVMLLRCTSCMNDKVDEILHGNNVSRPNHDMVKDYIMWILQFYNKQAFTDPVKDAWETFFECMWNVLEESQERQRIKELEEQKAREMEEQKAREMEEMEEIKAKEDKDDDKDEA